MERNLSWNDAWHKIQDIIDSLDDKDAMLPMLGGQIHRVLDIYYQKQAHADILLDIVENIRAAMVAVDEQMEDEEDEEEDSRQMSEDDEVKGNA
jgi:hypothetical protein